MHTAQSNKITRRAKLSDKAEREEIKVYCIRLTSAECPAASARHVPSRVRPSVRHVNIWKPPPHAAEFSLKLVPIVKVTASLFDSATSAFDSLFDPSAPSVSLKPPAYSHISSTSASLFQI